MIIKHVEVQIKDRNFGCNNINKLEEIKTLYELLEKNRERKNYEMVDLILTDIERGLKVLMNRVESSRKANDYLREHGSSKLD